MPSASAVHRLTLHRYVPEMGLLIVGSQGYPQVDLLYVLRYDDRVAIRNRADRANDETRRAANSDGRAGTACKRQQRDGYRQHSPPLGRSSPVRVGPPSCGVCASDNCWVRNRKRR